MKIYLGPNYFLDFNLFFVSPGAHPPDNSWTVHDGGLVGELAGALAGGLAGGLAKGWWTSSQLVKL